MRVGLLTLVTFVPALGAVLLVCLPRRRDGLLRAVAFGVATLDFLLSLALYFRFNPGNPGMQFVERARWMPGFGVSYVLGIDGISLLLVLLATLLTALALLSAWTAIRDRLKEFLVTVLLLETGMLGVFVALDLFLFYIFWEAMLIPMYFLIGVWGGERKIYAAIKFVLYTMTGSVLMLLAILALYFHHEGQTGQYTFDLLTLQQTTLPPRTQVWLFLAFALAFAIKVPMVPFHTWLPDAHVEAPTAGSVLLAGVLLKMGTYGFLRFCLPLFPHASIQFTPVIAWLAIIGIIYGAWVAMVQPDLKKLVAYSSVSHLGFVMLGLFALNLQGIEGGLLQMVNHGLSTGALFLLVGMIYERRHTRLIEEFGGLWRVLPVFSSLFLVVTLSSIGLPGLNGFVGEFLILVGIFQVKILWAVLATSGIIFAAVYMLWMYQRAIFGPIRHDANRFLTDLSFREVAVLAPIIVLIVWIGVYPKPFLSVTEASVSALVNQVQAKIAQAR